nr:uncharacterized protein LOC115262608 [Aedes albopictus]
MTPNPVSQPGRRNVMLLSSEDESTPKPVSQPGRRNAMLLSSEDEWTHHIGNDNGSSSSKTPLSVQRSAHKQPGNDAQPGQPAGPPEPPLSVQRRRSRSAHKQPGNDAQPRQPAGPSEPPLSVQRPASRSFQIAQPGQPAGQKVQPLKRRMLLSSEDESANKIDNDNGSSSAVRDWLRNSRVANTRDPRVRDRYLPCRNGPSGTK